MATMFNLPDELAEEILSRVPLTSLSSVRSTCRKWDTLSQNRVFGTSASAGRKQFLGFMLKDYKDKFRLFVWNPYLGQTRWIQPRNTYRSEDRYAIGYEKNLNYKILKSFGEYDTKGELGSIDEHLVFLGHTYFLTGERWTVDRRNRPEEIISFDFTTERFGKRLPLPSKSHSLDKCVSLSCVREEQLAVLHVSWVNAHAVEIWVTNKIDPGAVSWIKFVRSISVFVDDLAGSFFITRKSKFLWVSI
ncbi:hypothetical protein DY000_02043215 [Brassica cretica]|uniref:F-box domain-containing protein n=1 Tax=Brassica cretica TaxID=69181 RepID=A0ABQ7BGV3_BRACR|nr:hypothetical protein DY000_02043215 [Brassica cretica]